ncbi:MAG: endonuclease/exonuclease/phosphatase family protein [Verrucomicrobiota bacterium]
MAIFLLLGNGGFFGSASAYAQERKAAPVVEGEIRFLSYNLRNYLPMKRRVDGVSVEDAPKPEDEIDALIKVVVESKPDIVGVCEIGGLDYLQDFQRRLKKAGIDLPHLELVEASTEYERNLALLSRFPIVERDPQTDLTYLIGDKRLPFQRGILDVTIAPNPTYRLRLVGLHLKSKREVPQADQALMRRNEAQLARQHIDAILGEQPGVNLIVYGDLNDTKNEAPVRTLRGRYRSDYYLTAINVEDQYGFRWTHYWNYADSYARFDFALASKGVLREIDKKKSYIPHGKDWYLASDHRPLMLVIMPKDR